VTLNKEESASERVRLTGYQLTGLLGLGPMLGTLRTGGWY